MFSPWFPFRQDKCALKSTRVSVTWLERQSKPQPTPTIVSEERTRAAMAVFGMQYLLGWAMLSREDPVRAFSEFSYFFMFFANHESCIKWAKPKINQFLRWILVESLKMIHFWKGLLWDLFGAFSSQAFPRFQSPGYGKRLACRGLEVLRWVERRRDHTFSDSQSQKFCYSRFLMHVMVKLELRIAFADWHFVFSQRRRQIS